MDASVVGFVCFFFPARRRPWRLSEMPKNAGMSLRLNAEQRLGQVY